MKTVKMTIAAAVMMLAMAATPALAQAKPQSFGILDISKIMKETTAAKSILGEMDAKFNEIKTQTAKEENTLHALHDSILKKKDTLKKEDFDQQRADFEKKLETAQKSVQERKRMLEKAYNESMSKLRNEALKITAEISREKGFTAVFAQDAIVMAEPAMDITDLVIQRLNKDVKKIPVVWSAAATKK